MSTDESFVTLATNDSYALGALVLANSLKEVGTTKQLAILITTGVTEPLRQQLNSVFNSVTYVDALDSGDAENLQLLTRPDLGVTFTKLHCWRLTQYNKCVFLDADTLVVQNIDDLFEREELSAAPDVGWPDCFNSGVFVYRPSLDTYRSLLSFAVTHGSFDGGDQGLLNAYFSDWATKDIRKRLPYVYNVVAQTFYSYKPALKQFGKDVKVIHFIGATKPWHLTYNISTDSVVSSDPSVLHSQDFLQLWWKIFINRVKGTLDVNTVLLSEDMCRLSIYTAHQLGDEHRQYSWERGHVDYLGIDSFENIQRQLDAKIQEKPGATPLQPAHSAAVTPPAAVVAPPAAVVTPPAAVVTPPAAVVTPPAAVVTPPVAVVTPPKAAVTPPAAAVKPPAAVAAPPQAAGKAVAPPPQAVGQAKPAPQAAGQAKPAPQAAGQAKPAPQAAGPAKPAPQAAGQAKPAPQAAGPAKPAPQAAGQAKPAPQAAGPAKPAPQAAGQKTSGVTIASTKRPEPKK